MAKFPWGDNAFDDRLFLASLIYSAVTFTVLLQMVIPTGGQPAIDSGMAMHPTFSKKGEQLGGGVAGTIIATLAWIWIYWNGFGIQVFTRMNHMNLSDGASNCTGRIMGNTLEHAVVFLPLMWLHCAYINSVEAHYLGLWYAANRVGYHILFGYFGQFTYACEFTTGPSMSVIYYFFLSLLCKAGFDTTWSEYLPKSALMVPAIMVQSVVFFMIVWGVPTGHLVSGLVNKAHPVKKGK